MPDPSWMTRRKVLQLGVAGVAGMALYSGELARHELEVVQLTVKLANLPDAFHGFRIVQISDLHFHEYTETFFLRAVLRRVNALRPDAVLLTGDFISNARDHTYPIAQAHICGDILKMLECPIRYGVLGNHDAAMGETEIHHALVSNGTPILLNKSVPIERGSSRIWLGGLRDTLASYPEPELAIPSKIRNPKEPVLLMIHEPDYIDELMKYPSSQSVGLVLSGHSHGGQVRLPFLPPLKAVLPPGGKKYVEGLFRVGNTQLYVNRGIGTTEVPFRLNCPPEITVLTLEQI